MDMARSTRLVILIKVIILYEVENASYYLVTYFPTNIVYPFTPRVTCIKIKVIFLLNKYISASVLWCYPTYDNPEITLFVFVLTKKLRKIMQIQFLVAAYPQNAPNSKTKETKRVFKCS